MPIWQVDALLRNLNPVLKELVQRVSEEKNTLEHSFKGLVIASQQAPAWLIWVAKLVPNIIYFLILPYCKYQKKKSMVTFIV